MTIRTDDARVEVDRRVLLDLLDLSGRAADSLSYADMTLSDALRGNIAQLEADLFVHA
jgi:hypothetical protein